jgi:hypothetical protein
MSKGDLMIKVAKLREDLDLLSGKVVALHKQLSQMLNEEAVVKDISCLNIKK